MLKFLLKLLVSLELELPWFEFSHLSEFCPGFRPWPHSQLPPHRRLNREYRRYFPVNDWKISNLAINQPRWTFQPSFISIWGAHSPSVPTWTTKSHFVIFFTTPVQIQISGFLSTTQITLKMFISSRTAESDCKSIETKLKTGIPLGSFNILQIIANKVRAVFFHFSSKARRGIATPGGGSAFCGFPSSSWWYSIAWKFCQKCKNRKSYHSSWGAFEMSFWAIVDNLRGWEHCSAHADLLAVQLEHVHGFWGVHGTLILDLWLINA